MIVGQILSGWKSFNADNSEHGEAAIGVWRYLSTGHFFEAIFENWESEFFQMFSYIFLTAKLFQWGSPESRSLFAHNEVVRIPCLGWLARLQRGANIPWRKRRDDVEVLRYKSVLVRVISELPK